VPNTPPLRKRTLCKKVRGGFIRLPLPRLLRHHFSGQLAGMKTAGGRIRNHRAHPPGNRAHGAGDRIRSRLLDTPQHYPRRKSELSVSSGRTGHRRLHHNLLRPEATRRREARQLDSDDDRQGLVHDPPPLQPTRTILRQDLATERDPTGDVIENLFTLSV
jgi:hypothetical protein